MTSPTEETRDVALKLLASFLEKPHARVKTTGHPAATRALNFLKRKGFVYRDTEGWYGFNKNMTTAVYNFFYRDGIKRL